MRITDVSGVRNETVQILELRPSRETSLDRVRKVPANAVGYFVAGRRAAGRSNAHRAKHVVPHRGKSPKQSLGPIGAGRRIVAAAEISKLVTVWIVVEICSHVHCRRCVARTRTRDWKENMNESISVVLQNEETNERSLPQKKTYARRTFLSNFDSN